MDHRFSSSDGGAAGASPTKAVSIAEHRLARLTSRPVAALPGGTRPAAPGCTSTPASRLDLMLTNCSDPQP